jgi:hypothetical protein
MAERVLVGAQDTVEIRYPTPSTWNTQVEVEVRVGASDIDTVLFGTRIPEAKTPEFDDVLQYQRGRTATSATTFSSSYVFEFERDTFYYTDEFLIDQIELRVPIIISAETTGPKNLTENVGECGYSINGGPWVNIANSKVAFTGNITKDSKVITNVSSTTGLFVGMSISGNPHISGMITAISGNTVTLTNLAKSSALSSSLTAYNTVRNGDSVRLRIKTENWYTTSTKLTCQISDETWGTDLNEPATTTTGTWSITTRAQKLAVPQFFFFDYVDITADEFGGWKYFNIPVTALSTTTPNGVDADGILRASVTFDGQISKDDGATWIDASNSPLLNVFAGDTIKCRVKIGETYTTKTKSVITVYSVAGEKTSTGFPNFRENNIEGTWGYSKVIAGVTQTSDITQTMATVTDDWYMWTEVDRYPDQFSLSPIYIISDGDEVTVSSTHTFNFAEPSFIQDFPDFVYRCDFTVSGLGTEYPAGAYDEINTNETLINVTNDTLLPGVNIGVDGINTDDVDGKTVEIECIVAKAGARIRRQRLVNGSYEYTEWSDRVYVINDDIVNVQFASPDNYNTTVSSIIRFLGPPFGSSLGNPTQGPSVLLRSENDKEDTITLKTRIARTKPYEFKLKNIYDAEPSDTYEDNVPLSGYDVNINGFVSSDNGESQIKTPLIQYSTNTINIPRPSTPTGSVTLSARGSSPTNYGDFASTAVRVGTATNFYEDEWLIFNKEGEDWIYRKWGGSTFYDEFEFPQFAAQLYFVLVGAGGGNGGDDAPNSFGGRGGKGNVLRGYISLSDELLFGSYRKIRVYAPKAGVDGISAVSGAAGGAGGAGYAKGGDGGAAGTANSDRSGGGGGGGGAAAITIVQLDENDNEVETLLVLAGGGAGGGGAGNDTSTQEPFQNANWSLVNEDNSDFGIVKSTLSGLSLNGNIGATNTAQGGGAGGGGGGYGNGGYIITEKRDDTSGGGGFFGDTGELLQSDDLDATGGTGGGAYYNSSYVTLLDDYNYGNFGAGPKEDGEVIIYYPPQDRTPIFIGTFEDEFDAEPAITIESNKIQVTDITGIVDVVVFNRGTQNAQFYLCDENQQNCQPQGASGFVTDGQWLYLEASPGNSFLTTYVVELTVGTRTLFWNITTKEKPDTFPDNVYEIPDKTNVEPSTPIDAEKTDVDYTPNVVESDRVQITGINTKAAITATAVAEHNVEISVCDVNEVCGAWLDPSDDQNPVLIGNGEYFKVRMEASTSYSTTVSTRIRVGTDPTGYVYNVTTRPAPDVNPEEFLFLSPEPVDPGTRTRSPNTIRINGLSEPVTFTVDDPLSDDEQYIKIIKNDVLLDTNTVTVENRDTIRLVYDAPNIIGKSWTFNVTAGNYTTTWFVQTAGNAATTPDPFTFTTKSGDAGTFVASDEIVEITGLADGQDVDAYLTNGGQIRIADSLASISSASWLQATENSKASVQNGKFIQIRLFSSLIPGLPKSTKLFVGSYSTTFTVYSAADPGDIIKGQWYSSIQPIVRDETGAQLGRFSTKFDGLPIGSMMPVFKDTTAEYNWGDLDGNINSRFHGWIYCDGRPVSKEDYPLLWELFTNNGRTAAYYGEDAITGEFFLPDMRNRKVLGTGVVDSSSSSSPIVNPTYSPQGSTSGNISGQRAGCVGGMWFIDTIDDPGYDGLQNTELEQVYTPAAGQKAQESPYFTVANIRTQGYNDVTDSIEFTTSGGITAPISIGSVRIFDIPLHTHTLITGQPDPARNKGIIFWGRRGGVNGDKLNAIWNFDPATPVNSQTRTKTAIINLWGYATSRVNSTDNDTIKTPNNPEQGPDWYYKYENHSGEIEDPDIAGGGVYFQGQYIPNSGYLSRVVIKFDAFDPANGGTANYNEIRSFIDWDGLSISERRWVAAVDIPEKEIGIKGFTPAEKSKHSHFLSLIQPGVLETTYSYGHSSPEGIAKSGTPSTDTVNVTFTALETGLEILPGTFVLSSNKQLIPTPELSPQNKVPLLTPYTWVKWMIKAF